ncbi:hypothetical protein A9798_15475 [Edwardsiella hoshinae]|uniref:Uncharacterized protein n=1 Tax=Edwardsiella hoshinae TaxID=93378 RepID=A0ABN4T2L9_9GAMM|nr:hypothetical protein A9798_15475 [Edwardsiella hoshinae]
MMSEKQTTSSVGTYLWGSAALGMAILSLTCNRAAIVVGASTGALILAALLGTLMGWMGALLGRAFCRLVHPTDATRSLFWLCGPHLIGLIGGVMLGCALALY